MTDKKNDAVTNAQRAETPLDASALAHPGQPGVWRKPVGQILPGSVKVEEIVSYEEEGQRMWRVTIVSRPGDASGLAVMEASVTFVTADSWLIEQLVERRLRYALDLIQLERPSADEGLLEVRGAQHDAAP